ncbi:WD40 repeat domain-containing protein [uncultured Campylobacter sp.]|uniref:WD40 repeat domain-containing protein n=1 Tax=uncultured Campylobacter sp. TaxID=218934 RepID=UPI002620DED4|nr:WD40 repeat domain-containing protein [uncultured Campylobacter sp.]
MPKVFVLLCFFAIFVLAKDLEFNANVSTVALRQDKILVGLDSGEAFIYDKVDKSLKNSVRLADVKNYYNDNVRPTVYSLDYLNNKLLILSEGNLGKKNLSLYENGVLNTRVLDFDSAKKVFFIDDENILLVLFSAQIKLLNLKDLRQIKDFSFSHYSLNDSSINKEKMELASVFESGVVELFDLKAWKDKKSYFAHKDNVYQVSNKKDFIVSCSTDKSIALINKDEIKYIRENFLIYSCALSSDAKFLSYANSEKNLVNIVDVNSLKLIKSIDTKRLMVENLIFLDDKELLISGFSNKIIFEDLK